MKIKSIIALTLALPVLSGCDFLGFGYWSWHQKLTLVVESPAGEISGSSVGTVKIARDPEWLKMGDEGGPTYSFRGEAIAVEVAPGRYLFATLQGYGWETAWHAFLPTDEPKNRADAGQYYSMLQNTRDTRFLPEDKYPLLVTLDDIDDPASVKRVNPENLAAVFGDGYRLKSIAITITDEPVTKGSIEKILPWLADVGRERGSVIPTNLRRMAEPAIKKLSSLEFSTELYR